MSETKHTPGPWELGNGGSVVTQTPDAQVDMTNYKAPGLIDYDVQDTIKFYGGHVICETVTKANARFIAKAPAMFSTLVALVESDNAGITILRKMAYCIHCDHAALVADEVEHADDCPIVVARNLIETLVEKENKNDE